MSYSQVPNYPPPATPGFTPAPATNWTTNAYNTMQNLRPSAIQSRAYTIMESKESSGGIKATLIIILIAVLIGCCVLSWTNHFAQDSVTVGVLIFLNVITVLGMGLALLYGMGKGRRDPVATGGGDDFFSTSYDLELTDL
jgi:hypothetical protein